MTLEQLSLLSSDESTSSPGDTLASHSAWPGNDAATTILVTSGRKCAALLTRRDPVTSWRRTLLGTSRWASTLFLLKWKPTATPQGRLLFRLVPSMPSTAATGFGSWPTPKAQEDNRSPEVWEAARQRHYQTRREKGTSSGGPAGKNGSLQVYVKAVEQGMKPDPIPTPTQDSVTTRSKPYAQGGLPLTAYVQAWPTPRHEGFDAGGHRGTNDSLHSAVKAEPWGTPTSRPSSPGSSVENVPENGLLGRQAVNRSGQTGQKLHGRWTLALMGFAPDWCDDLPPDPLGTTPT